MSNPNTHHIEAAKRVIKYLKGTRDRGISFTSRNTTTLNSFVKFPTPSPLTSMCDANWGPQDASKPSKQPQQQLDLFKTRSLSGFLLWLQGPLHWCSKRQTITARSTAEAEIYSTDECVKALLHLQQLVSGLKLTNELMPPPNIIHNDNAACVAWSHNMTTKGLRHIQIRENAVRESVQNGFVQIKHVAGDLNLSDLFTKEDKDDNHFLKIRDILVTARSMRFCSAHSRGGVKLGECFGSKSSIFKHRNISIASQ